MRQNYVKNEENLFISTSCGLVSLSFSLHMKYQLGQNPQNEHRTNFNGNQSSNWKINDTHFNVLKLLLHLKV